jgi:hypothetical protein
MEMISRHPLQTPRLVSKMPIGPDTCADHIAPRGSSTGGLPGDGLSLAILEGARVPDQTFEEILLTPRRPKCKTCQFIAGLQEPLQSQVKAAVAKAIYSDEAIARGFAKVESEYNIAPKEGSVRSHRIAGHA